mmetsp:Transcript_21979/g.34453  ORF Transcript_21979/g.34453 Transcript_21979/m.34453 type:complete len:244 (-) Transcript_21979:231-962(-)
MGNHFDKSAAPDPSLSVSVGDYMRAGKRGRSSRTWVESTIQESGFSVQAELGHQYTRPLPRLTVSGQNSSHSVQQWSKQDQQNRGGHIDFGRTVRDEAGTLYTDVPLYHPTAYELLNSPIALYSKRQRSGARRGDRQQQLICPSGPTHVATSISGENAGGAEIKSAKNVSTANALMHRDSIDSTASTASLDIEAFQSVREAHLLQEEYELVDGSSQGPEITESKPLVQHVLPKEYSFPEVLSF